MKEIFSKSTEYITHKPESTNYYKGIWLRHPAQYNLYNLNVDEKVKIIKDFISKPTTIKPQNYEEWLKAQFGNYFSENFPEIYTKKYWQTDAKNLTTTWLGNRFNIPSIDQVLKGAMEKQEDNHYYAKEMRYPQKGGYKSFLNSISENLDIQLNHEVSNINLKNKTVSFKNGFQTQYDKLISSLPLTEIIQLIQNAPNEVLIASQKLCYTSGQLVSIGFNRPDIPKELWFYIYDEDILPSRVYSPSLKSSSNVPEGKSSLQFETYFTTENPPKLRGNDLIDHIINKGEKNENL